MSMGGWLGKSLAVGWEGAIMASTANSFSADFSSGSSETWICGAGCACWGASCGWVSGLGWTGYGSIWSLMPWVCYVAGGSTMSLTAGSGDTWRSS